MEKFVEKMSFQKLSFDFEKAEAFKLLKILAKTPLQRKIIALYVLKKLLKKSLK